MGVSAGCTIACVSVSWHGQETRVCDGCALRVHAVVCVKVPCACSVCVHMCVHGVSTVCAWYVGVGGCARTRANTVHVCSVQGVCARCGCCVRRVPARTVRVRARCGCCAGCVRACALCACAVGVACVASVQGLCWGCAQAVGVVGVASVLLCAARVLCALHVCALWGCALGVSRVLCTCTDWVRCTGVVCSVYMRALCVPVRRGCCVCCTWPRAMAVVCSTGVVRARARSVRAARVLCTRTDCALGVFVHSTGVACSACVCVLCA